MINHSKNPCIVPASRRLAIEYLEARVPLAAVAELGIPSLSAAEILAMIRDRQLSTLSETIRMLETGSASISSPSSPANEASISETSPPSRIVADEPMVSFRIDVHDSQGQQIENVSVDDIYSARVYVQDVVASDTITSLGGVFQAIVDLHFSSNVRPVGNIAVEEEFAFRPSQVQFDQFAVRGIGGINRQVLPVGRQEQLLLRFDFQVIDDSQPVQFQVTPAQSVTEPILLYGLDVPIPEQNVLASSLNIAADQSNADLISLDGIPIIRPGIERFDSQDGSAQPSQLAASVPRSVGSGTRIVSFFSVTDSARQSDQLFRPEQDWLHQVDDFPSLDDQNGEEDEPRWHELDLGGPFRAFPDFSEQIDESSIDSELDDHPAEPNEDDDMLGLFYDETLFLEGAIVESFRSRFRLQFHLFSWNQRSEHNKDVGPPIDDNQSKSSGWTDIAAILRPHSDPSSDPASDLPIVEDPDVPEGAITTVHPLEAQRSVEALHSDLAFGRVEHRNEESAHSKPEATVQPSKTDLTPDSKDGI